MKKREEIQNKNKLKSKNFKLLLRSTCKTLNKPSLDLITKSTIMKLTKVLNKYFVFNTSIIDSFVINLKNIGSNNKVEKI